MVPLYRFQDLLQLGCVSVCDMKDCPEEMTCFDEIEFRLENGIPCNTTPEEYVNSTCGGHTGWSGRNCQVKSSFFIYTVIHVLYSYIPILLLGFIILYNKKKKFIPFIFILVLY